MPPAPRLVLATTNRKKGQELAELFGPLGLVVDTLADFSNALRVEETGQSFAENAALKATAQARHLGQWTLGEDSGLSVDALGGAPGVFSARFAGESADDEANNAKLLNALLDVPLERRAAHYVCHMTLADPTGAIRAETDGQCRGRILLAPRGTHGFGYDPLFEIVEYHRPFGELGPHVKACLSHRARAARRMAASLARLLEAGSL
ncbi:MAG: RdgB/HAM1 family non-canonical purine NTP pyrophosphatase [Pirellulales bacterium]|nr:RdgB/HAM1 family non-canonical purine NTP pyrophosphatase [Pirellulales bacterium]